MNPLVAYKALSIGSGLLKASSLNNEGKAKAAAHQFNAGIANRNAAVSEIQAETTRFANSMQITKFMRETEYLMDNIGMANRSNGWLADEGTPLKIAQAAAEEIDADMQIMAFESGVQVQSIREAAVQSRLQAQLNTMYAGQARAAGKTAAIGSLLGTATNIAMIGAFA
tara:strand:- start:11380 stop:11886 length:507 start_codon:yes stop_codon:yes gene_type:complete